MSRSIFGYSYPPGCSGPPDEPEIVQPRCECGAFLSFKPIRSEPWEAKSHCDGKVDEQGLAMCGWCDKDHEPHDEVYAAGVDNFYKCGKCGKEKRITC